MRTRIHEQVSLPIAALLGAALFFIALPADARLNPSSVYCRSLGYEYVRGHTPEGVLGLCKLPDGRHVDAWRFYSGEVALDFSYCAQQGLEPRHSDDPTVCWNCTVCVMPDGTLVSAYEAMGMDTRESRCGDGKCGTMENIGNCPGDCPSGLYDEYCDGEADGICDRDCTNQSLPDPDCEGPGPGVDGGTGTGPGSESSGCGCRAASPSHDGLVATALLCLAGLGLGRRSRRVEDGARPTPAGAGGR